MNATICRDCDELFAPHTGQTLCSDCRGDFVGAFNQAQLRQRELDREPRVELVELFGPRGWAWV